MLGIDLLVISNIIMFIIEYVLDHFLLYHFLQHFLEQFVVHCCSKCIVYLVTLRVARLLVPLHVLYRFNDLHLFIHILYILHVFSKLNRRLRRF